METLAMVLCIAVIVAFVVGYATALIFDYHDRWGPWGGDNDVDLH